LSEHTMAELATRLMRAKFDRYVNRDTRLGLLAEIDAVAEFAGISAAPMGCRIAPMTRSWKPRWRENADASSVVIRICFRYVHGKVSRFFPRPRCSRRFAVARPSSIKLRSGRALGSTIELQVGGGGISRSKEPETGPRPHWPHPRQKLF